MRRRWRGASERIGKRRRVARQCAIDHGAFAREACVVDSGAAAGPPLAAPAEQCRGKRGGGGGVADSHFAQADEIGSRCHRLKPDVDRRKELLFAHRRRCGEISRRLVERQRQHAQLRICDPGQLIDGRAACREIRNHLHGDRSGIRGNALGRDAVVSGEHQDIYALETRRTSALPARKPCDRLLEAAQTAGRLGERFIARRNRHGSRCIARRNVAACGGQLGQRRKSHDPKLAVGQRGTAIADIV